MDKDLFFFGSKRMWLFPENLSEELQEEREQDEVYGTEMSNYASPEFPQSLKDFILEKESRSPSEVFYLKPTGFVYHGFPNGCHKLDENAPRFKEASDWLETLGLQPMNLDAQWW